MNLTINSVQKWITAKTSVETITKPGSKLYETEMLKKNAKTENLKMGGGNSERPMKGAHAYKMRKRKQGLMKAPLRMKRFEKTMCVRVQGGRKRD